MVGDPLEQGDRPIELLEQDDAGDLVVEDGVRELPGALGPLSHAGVESVGPPDREGHGALEREGAQGVGERVAVEALPALVERYERVAGTDRLQDPLGLGLPDGVDVPLEGNGLEQELLDPAVPTETLRVVVDGGIGPGGASPPDADDPQPVLAAQEK